MLGVPEIVMAVSSLAFDASMQPGVRPMLLVIVRPCVVDKDRTHAGELVFTYAAACVLNVGSMLVNKDTM
jgi:hypothetical protein